MRVPLRAGLLCAVLTLTVPAAAQADTLNVPGDHPTIQAAVDAAAEGDTINVAAGDYAENVAIDKPLTVVGVDGARVLGTGGDAADVVTVSAAGVVLETLGLESTRGSAVQTTGAGGVTVKRSLVTRTAGPLGTPAVAGDGAAGVVLEDVIAFNATGPGLVATTSDGNAVVRSILVSIEGTEATSDAVRLVAGSAGARKLVSDSSVFVGGATAAGVRVVTEGAPVDDTTTLSLRHATVVGAANALVLDATQPKAPILNTSSGPAGAIVADVTASILHEVSTVDGDNGLPNPVPLLAPLQPPTTAALTITRSDTPDPVAGQQATVTKTESQFTSDLKALFGSGMHLRADAPVIDKGGAAAADESATDIDGEPRSSGPATDMGADEFVNKPPKAALTASNATPLQDEVVTFTSTSTDPDAGDLLTTYAWDFGDGSPVVTTAAPGVSHAYSKVGTFTAKLAVIDRFGASSPVAELPITVRDGQAPEVRITAPRHGARLTLNPKKKKGAKRRPRPRPLTVLGTDSDATGVASVQVAITRKGKRKCRHYTGRQLKKGACDQLRFVDARLVGNAFQLTTRRGMRLKRGRYVIRARGTDLNGITGSQFSRKSGSLVRIRVK